MAQRRTQAERTAASDSAMFKAAIEIIAEEGPDNMTLARVGKMAGFTGGLVSYRFGSKSGLLQAVSERILELWSRQAIDSPKLEKAEGVERIKLVAELYLKNVKSRSSLMVALHRLMHASYGSCPDLLPYFQEWDLSVRAQIKEIIDSDPNIRDDVDIDAFATVYIGALRGVTQQYFINSKKVNLDKTKKMIWMICDDLLID